MFLSRLVSKAFQVYWRRSRGLALKVECCVLDDAGSVLLASKTTGGTWAMPAVTAYRDESAWNAVARALTPLGIAPTAAPNLVWIFEPTQNEPRYTALYIVRHWHRIPQTVGSEARATFFPRNEVPQPIDEAVAARIRNAAQLLPHPEMTP